jgi:hypothetical protein
LLQMCHALLCPNGILVIAVPNEVTSLRNFVRKRLRMVGVKSHRLGAFGLPRISLGPDSHEVHLSHFTPHVLHRLLQTTGFSVIESTLDPYYVETGFAGFKADIYYLFCTAFLRIFDRNVYDAMLVIARKTGANAATQLADSR